MRVFHRAETVHGLEQNGAEEGPASPLGGRDTPCLNVMFHPQNPSHVILHDTYMLCILDQSLVRTNAG